MNIGSKAQSLQKLKEAGFNVPPFFVCDESWTEDRILHTLDKKLSHTNYFAVRSSASGEDGEQKSYAGHFYSGIAIKRSEVLKEIRKVLDSFGDLSGSVIIQEFIASDVSGVAFSDNGDDIIVINSSFGLCKNVVEGKACDEYLVSKDGRLVRKSISNNKPALYFRNEALQESEQSAPSLNQKQIKQVARLAKKVEGFFKKPQDIEWCFQGEILYLLQSRPITKTILILEQEYFDSANIAESYSGIVLPLTASFAERIYKMVYTDFLRMSGVPKKTLKKHAYVFENLLGFSHGRMYYNMNNWYRMAQFVPGYKRNKENFETMISSNLRQEIATTIKPGLLFTIAYPLIILVKALLFNTTEKRFKRYVERHIKELKKTNFEILTLEECQNLFSFLENDFLRKWYITLENDFFVMTYLGILQKLYPEENLQDMLVFKSKATEQVGSLAELSKETQRTTDLWETVRSGDKKLFGEILKSKPDLHVCYEKYLEKFGGRFANELKLETVGIDEDIQKFMNVLRAYETYTPKKAELSNAKAVKLSFFRKNLFKHSLKRFKKYASQREDFRLFRSNMFSITRSIFRRVGVILEEQKLLRHSDDVFYMSVAEVLSVSAGHDIPNLISKITERKQRFIDYRKETPPPHFLAIGGEMLNDAGQTSIEPVIARGVSAGIASGRVKVMKEFEMPNKVDFDILVTKHTDPGWTALIALSKGLIIEHGGVLSHASIVARELGIPAVIGVRGATDLYRDGQMVEINGSTGNIKLL
ncbi:MAG: PEP/pyruvate-binding domain-containing protein [bacterium]|nr:PEP/pyruvate-binding domain-containing protein [bacterium]